MLDSIEKMRVLEGDSMFVNGKIKVDAWNFEISNQLQEKEFLSSNLASQIKPLVHNGEYRSYYTEADAQVGPAVPVPAFGASGSATQYLPGCSIQQLIDDGFLSIIK